MRLLFRLTSIQKQRFLKFMAATSSTKASPRVYLQVLGAQTEDTSPSLFIFADSQRYLFNCGEGTQRIFNEQKLKLSKLNNIFLTRICWEYVGGLPGMAMTLRDNGKSEIKLLGPSNLSDFIHATRFFLYHESLKFDCVGFTGSDGEEYKDENLTIWPVIINGSSKSLHDSSTSSNDEEDLPSPKKLKFDFKVSTAISYICQLAPLPGKFFPKKAIKLGVPKGPLFGELQSGKTVTLQDGRQIQPEQVMEANQPGPLFMIIECPSVDYIPSLVTNKQLNQYWEENTRVMPAVIVHLTPMIVFENEEYKQWRERQVNPLVSHLLINKDVCATPLIFQSQATVQCKLHCIDPEIFPLLETNNIPDVTALPKNCVSGETFLQFHLRPLKQQGFDKTNIPQKLNIDSTLQETQTLLTGSLNTISVPSFQLRNHDRTELATSLGLVRSISTSSSSGSQDLITDRGTTETIKNCVRDALEAVGTKVKSLAGSVERKAQQFFSNHENYEVVFLGTGASIPSKYRNVSSTLINMSNQGSILLDCGEGTYGQLFRHYGKCVDRVLSQVKCVFISHIHADHHLGLIRILQKRDTLGKEVSCDPLLVIGPDKIGQWLTEYNTMCEDINYRFVDSSDLVVQRDGDHLNVLGHLHAEEVLTVPVDHCPESYGLVLKHQHGWKVVYSGDTRPSPALIEAGNGADLLIHEATLEDELKAEALAKKHSTTTEAIESGMKMEAKFIMLNHFSQRYPKIPIFSEQFTKYTGIAFDHMKINSSNLSRIPQLLGPLQTVFAEEIDEMNKSK
ncbi:unnamed protein product [Porites evermanni]|uniref:ribonuclease Z n=1 Tax=Porites evermanni TaxID=104178 RepID=A0ABN8LIJ6_9CNID|nr:unnamed protein product [Porites evermanni]